MIQPRQSRLGRLFVTTVKVIATPSKRSAGMHSPRTGQIHGYGRDRAIRQARAGNTPHPWKRGNPLDGIGDKAIVSRDPLVSSGGLRCDLSPDPSLAEVSRSLSSWWS